MLCSTHIDKIHIYSVQMIFLISLKPSYINERKKIIFAITYIKIEIILFKKFKKKTVFCQIRCGMSRDHLSQSLNYYLRISTNATRVTSTRFLASQQHNKEMALKGTLHNYKGSTSLPAKKSY